MVEYFCGSGPIPIRRGSASEWYWLDDNNEPAWSPQSSLWVRKVEPAYQRWLVSEVILGDKEVM